MASGGYEVDESLAAALQEEQDVQDAIHLQGDASSEGDQYVEESEESEGQIDDEVICFLTEEMMAKVFEKYSTSKDFQQSLLEISSPADFQIMMNTITEMVDAETCKLRTLMQAKIKLEKMIKSAKKPVKEKEISDQKKKGLAIYDIIVSYNGQDYNLQMKGRATFRMLRHKLQALHPEIFESETKMTKKMIFTVVGSDKPMGTSGRKELLAWGATRGKPLVIRAVDGKPPSSTSASSSTSKPKDKKDTKKKEDEK